MSAYLLDTSKRGKEQEKETGVIDCVLCKIHKDCGGHNTIVPRVEPVAHIVRRSPTDIVDHATERMDAPPGLVVPPCRRHGRSAIAWC